MKKYLIIFLLVLTFLILVFSGIFVYIRFFAKEEDTQTIEIVTSSPVYLDSKKVATHLSKVFDTEGVYWTRMFELYWNEVEREKGSFDWSFIDRGIREFNHLEIYPIVIIKPFANWDQDACHGEEYEADFDPMKGGRVKVGKPCDMDSYAVFLEKAVERYDGDGINDMPGLEIPVKYWEVMNELSMQGGSIGGMGEELKFFVGTSEDYLEILKVSYEVIKRVDTEAKVIQGGQAGMQENFLEFWRPILEDGGGDYFDIANIHSISTDERREDLFVIKFKEFLKEYRIEDKSIWITEVQFGSLTERPDSSELKEFEILMVKSSVFSLAQGADKLFYIENWMHWNGQEGWKSSEEDIQKATDSSTHKVYLNLVDKINEYDEIIIILEEFVEYSSNSEGAFSEIGQYKFVDEDSSVYVLWGQAQMPSEISGNIKVTDIYGDRETIDAGELVLADEPVFVEVL